MTRLDTLANSLNRTVKIALDTGEASSIEHAERIFSGYQLQIVVGPDVAQNPVMQAALLTSVNCASRTFLGGVTVVGGAGPLRVTLPGGLDLPDAVVGLGGVRTEAVDPHAPTLVIGAVEASLEPLAIRATFDGWCGGVTPVGSPDRPAERGTFTPAGVLAGALGVSEIFQRVRGGTPMACRRSVGLDLWRPRRYWLSGDSTPELDRLPSSVWLVGLGHLGQAYLWVLGLLPYGNQAIELVLQDTDVVAHSTLSTSLLTRPTHVGERKTRALARWAEARGFKTSIIERTFAADFRIQARDPAVALIGVDNGLARQAVEEVGFERVIEAGLGRGPQDFLGFDVHTFPASKLAREVWQGGASSEINIDHPAYAALLSASKDRCGTLRLAGRSIGAPFVGATAAALVIGELLRLGVGGPRHELISCHLRDLEGRIVVPGEPWAAFNPGTVRLAA